jgi:hypothetical protein
LVSETEKGFQIRKAPPTEAAVETPETTGDALRQMGKRAILPSEAEGFTGHFDVEGFGLWIGDHRSHCATPSMVACDEMQQQVSLGMFAPDGG